MEQTHVARPNDKTTHRNVTLYISDSKVVTPYCCSSIAFCQNDQHYGKKLPVSIACVTQGTQGSYAAVLEPRILPYRNSYK